MVSADGRTAIMPLTMAGDLTQAEDNIDKVHAIVHEADGRAASTRSSPARRASTATSAQTANRDLQRGEGIGVPIALVILLLVFGTLVAAALPIFLSLIAITLAVALTALLGQTFDVSVFAINMITMMGLATGIDYSLFIVSRFREERLRGRDKVDAIAATGGTASRAVFFSGMTVVLALLGMLIVPTNIFASLGAGAILVVAMSVLAALTLLPAVLSLLGDRVNRLRVPYLGRRLLDVGPRGRARLVARVAQRAMRRPAIALVVGVGVLLLAASPLLDMKTGVSGVEQLPRRLRVQAGVRRARAAVLGGRREPRADRRRRARRAAPQVTAAVPACGLAGSTTRPSARARSETAKSGDLTLVLGARRRASASRRLAIAKVRELRDTLHPRGVRRERRRRLRDRRHRGQRRLHGHRQPLLPLTSSHRARAQLRAAAARLPLGRHPGARRSS